MLDDNNVNAKKITRLAFCSGKVYYDLIERREAEKCDDIAFIRLEQLYPFPKKQVDAILTKYDKVKEYIFVQEEPENMGAWNYILRMMRSKNIQLISRPESASPATGSHEQHEKEQQEIIHSVFATVNA